MSESLVTYLQDHLAGASHALDLLSWMSEAHKDDSLGTFASTPHAEITEDRDVLVGLAQRLATGSSASKETGAWLSEKIARLKLADQGTTKIGTFESLEFLVLGIRGKRALWQELMVASVRISWDGGEVAPVPRFPVSRGGGRQNPKTASVPKNFVSL